MITAKEANELYDELLLQRDNFIYEVIEPAIRKDAPMSKETTFKSVNYYYLGTSFDFSLYKFQIKTEVEKVKLTKEIFKVLRENGYEVFDYTSSGTEFQNGSGTIVISWEK